jgi:hypothetical protein
VTFPQHELAEVPGLPGMRGVVRDGVRRERGTEELVKFFAVGGDGRVEEFNVQLDCLDVIGNG